MMPTDPQAYTPADTAWFAGCRMGVSAHWTAQTTPRHGPSASFPDAVEAFDVPHFLAQVQEAGASYVLFTVTHAWQYLPAPSEAVDRILPGRTCRRDLLGDLADGCAKRGLHLLLYYNHSCNHADDPAWEQAVGYHAADKRWLVDNLSSIVREMGVRYGQALRAWWFDSAYSLDPTGPYSSVTTDMRGFRFPWEDFAAVAKMGHPGRLVSFNPGFGDFQTHLYTRHQDYLAGEQLGLGDPPTTRWVMNGLQNHYWCCLDNSAWAHAKPNTAFPPVRYGRDQLRTFLDGARRAQTPITLNIDITQDGLLNPAAIAVLATTG